MPLIYIVEDDVNIREIQRYALKNSGFETEEFSCKEQLNSSVYFSWHYYSSLLLYRFTFLLFFE